MDSSILLAAELNEDAPTIDLHSTTNISDALLILERELFAYAQNGHEYCRVIHGIGTGRLMNAVHEALEKNPMIHQYKKMEHGGSTVVVF